jgi:glycosyltransferase involved in cell wall biosynthesis
VLLLRLCDRFRGPKIIVNHGCNMVDGCSAERMRELVGQHIMVSRTDTAAQLWNVDRSHVVTAGLTASEWPETDYSRGNVVMLRPCGHAQFYNAAAAPEIERRIARKVNWLGTGPRFANFDAYRSLLTSSSIYFNHCYAVPAPQAMLEAQLCGLAIVTTDRHGESSYIVNGENGFVSNDMEALLAHVRFLGEHPQELQRIGANGRTTAQRIFGSERFLAEWEALLAEAVSGAQLGVIAGAGE